MKKFIGLFLVTLAFATSANSAANQEKRFTVVRGAVEADTNLVSLNEVAKRFMRNEKGETIIVLAEKTEPQKDSQKLAIIRQADPNASALLVADWTPDQHKVVRSKDASNLTAVNPAAQSKGIIQKPGRQDAHAEQGVVVTVVKGWPLNGVDLTPVTRQKFAKDITLRNAKDTSDLEVTSEAIKALTIDVMTKVGTCSAQTGSENENDEINFEGQIFDSMEEVVAYATNYVSNSFSAKEIFFAVDNDDLMFLKRVIRAGEDVNTRDAVGNTPLHFATSIDCVQELVQNGADANVTNLLGKTPLHYAVTRNSLPIVRYLVKKGNAFIWAMDNAGHTPYDLAPAGRVAKYLKSLMKSSQKSTRKKKKATPKKEKPDIDALVESTAQLSL